MKLLYKIFRLILLVGHLLSGLVLTFIAFSPLWRSTHFPNRVVIWWSRTLCQCLHLQIRCYGDIATPPCLLVANHITWLDVFVLLRLSPITFVSKHEISSWPIIGWLARRVGTLFVRRGFDVMSVVTEEMATVLTNGAYVALFPEGTTTDGTAVKRFHARMFQAAITANVTVQPIALRYPRGTGVSKIVPYVGDDTFLSNTWRLVGETAIPVEIWFCPLINANGKTRRELADYAQMHITQVLTQSKADIQDLGNPKNE
ncbi:MAG: hypothetical protein BWK79_03325 [Beggiatoa sp. IS2]|nr:MAG: hypothetical protein BWK79_03325 [Beggiatoa sp. IS2]